MGVCSCVYMCVYVYMYCVCVYVYEDGSSFTEEMCVLYVRVCICMYFCVFVYMKMEVDLPRKNLLFRNSDSCLHQRRAS